MNKLRKLRNSASGFTLIELLIVIVIIGILAGILLTVIDPARQQRKAKESVLRATVEKGCLALHACGGTSTDATTCDSMTEAGIKDPTGTPPTATYFIRGDTATTASNSVAAGATATVGLTGHLVTGAETCRFQCAFDFSATGGAVPMSIPAGSTCLIGVQ